MKKVFRKLFIWSPFFLMFVYLLNFQEANSHSAQPDTGHVRDPVSNLSCARSGCHSSFPFFNASRANVTIGTSQANQVPLAGFQYATATQYVMNFTLTSTTARSGFEMSALRSTNTNAGTFAVTNATNTSLQSQSGISYIGHKSANSNSTWSFNWTSPATNVGNITFYTAVNKSNNSGSSTGDSIFHQTFVITGPVLSANAGNDVTICPNASTTLQATAVNGSGAATYAWAPATNLTCTTCANPTASPSSTTTYTVTITSGGQTASDAVTVNTFSTSPPIINSTANIVCPGGSVTLSSSGFNAYSWSTGGNTSSTSVTTGGTYFLTVTDANTCTTSNSRVIQQGQTPSPTISSTQPFLCGGNSTTLSAGNFSTYQWSNATTTPTTNVSQAGSYSVTVTNAAGCSASATFNLLSYSLPTANVSVSGPLTFCSGGDVTFNANSGTAYTYRWSTGATTAAITVSQSGNYRVTVYNPCDSAVSQIQNVTVNQVPVAQTSPSGSLLLCNGATQTLFANPTGLSYQWFKDDVELSGENTDSLVVNSNGNYSVEVTNANCSDTSSLVSVSTAGIGNASVNIVASQNQFCSGDVITLDADTGFVTYLWLPGNSTAQTLQITSAGTYIVNVTASNGQCTSSGADTIVIDTAPDVTAPTLSYNSTVCAGDTVTVTVTPNTYTVYNWSNGTSSSSLHDVTGNYTLTVSETGTCGTASASINAPGTPLPDASFTNNSGVLTAATGGAVYQWYLEGSEINGETSSTHIPNVTGNYSLEVTVNGCSSVSAPQLIIITAVESLDNEFLITVYPNPVTDMLKLNWIQTDETDLQILLSNLDGRLLREDKSINSHRGENTFDLDVSNLPQGIYVIHLQNNYFRKTIKVIKQNP